MSKTALKTKRPRRALGAAGGTATKADEDKKALVATLISRARKYFAWHKQANEVGREATKLRADIYKDMKRAGIPEVEVPKRGDTPALLVSVGEARGRDEIDTRKLYEALVTNAPDEAERAAGWEKFLDIVTASKAQVVKVAGNPIFVQCSTFKPGAECATIAEAK